MRNALLTLAMIVLFSCSDNSTNDELVVPDNKPECPSWLKGTYDAEQSHYDDNPESPDLPGISCRVTFSFYNDTLSIATNISKYDKVFDGLYKLINWDYNNKFIDSKIALVSLKLNMDHVYDTLSVSHGINDESESVQICQMYNGIEPNFGTNLWVNIP